MRTMPEQARDDEEEPMKKFIYMFVPMDQLYPQVDAMKFTKMGEQGWELVGFENGAAWFKKKVE